MGRDLASTSFLPRFASVTLTATPTEKRRRRRRRQQLNVTCNCSANELFMLLKDKDVRRLRPRSYFNR